MKTTTQTIILNNYKKFESDIKPYLIGVEAIRQKNNKDIDTIEANHKKLLADAEKANDNFMEEVKKTKKFLDYGEVSKLFNLAHEEQQKTTKHYILNRYIKNIYQNILYIYGYFIELEATKYCENNRDFNMLLSFFDYDKSETIRAYKGSYNYIDLTFKNYKNVEHNKYFDFLVYDRNKSKTDFVKDKIKPEEDEKRIIKNINAYLTKINFYELKNLKYKDLIKNIEKLMNLEIKHNEQLKQLKAKQAEEITKADPLTINKFLHEEK